MSSVKSLLECSIVDVCVCHLSGREVVVQVAVVVVGVSSWKLAPVCLSLLLTCINLMLSSPSPSHSPQHIPNPQSYFSSYNRLSAIRPYTYIDQYTNLSIDYIYTGYQYELQVGISRGRFSGWLGRAWTLSAP